MSTLIYNGTIDQALKDKYDEVRRKGRTVENMMIMAVSREVSLEKDEAYASTRNINFHAVK